MAKRKARRRSSSRSRSSNNKALSNALKTPSGGSCKTCGNSPCCCHSKGLGWLVLIIGILFLIKDLGGFAWWTVQWWTVLFVLWGLWMIRK